MGWKVVVFLVHLCAIIAAVEDDLNDIVANFFNNPPSCNNGKGICINRNQNCNFVTNDAECGEFMRCCNNKSDGTNGGIVFPTRPVRTTTTTTSTTMRTRATPSTTTTRRTTTTTTQRTTTTPTTTTTESYEDYDPPDCGVRQSDKDINVEPLEDAEREEFPWNVGIFTKEPHPIMEDLLVNVFHCGGTLIDDFVVLTATSCVSRKVPSSLYVIAGLWKPSDNQESRRQIRRVQKVVTHPQKNSDIAFIYLEDKIDYSRTVNRVCLPEPRVNFENSNCLVTGWGSTSTNENEVRTVLKSVVVKLEAGMDCERRLKRLSYQGRFTLDKSLQCAEEEEGAENTISKLDLGSPLLCTIPGRQKQFYQIGIFSRKHGESAPSVFTNITMFRGWIDDQMKVFDRDAYIYTPESIEGEDNSKANSAEE